jgi:hypothetical protein
MEDTTMDKVSAITKLMGYVNGDIKRRGMCELQSAEMLRLSNLALMSDKRLELRKLSEAFKISARKFDSTAAEAARLGYDIWKGMGEIERKAAWAPYKFTGVKYNDCPPEFREWAPMPDVVRHDCSSKE